MTAGGRLWFGSIPNHWREGNIRHFAAMKTGHTPSRAVPEYWADGDVPWFTLADVWQLRDGTRTHLGETATSISQLGLAHSAAELLPVGTVVVSRTASVGFSGIMPVPMATSQDFWNWVCGPDLWPKYLLYVFRAMQSHLRSLTMGSTHKTIYQHDAAGIRVPVPPIDEQIQIADFLDRETSQIDTLISKQTQLVEALHERRAAAVESIVLADQPAGFGARLKHFTASINQGWSPQCYPWPADGVDTWAVLKVGCVNGGLFRASENKELPSSETPRPGAVVRRGQMVVSRANTRELLGSAAVVEADYPRLMLSDKLYAFDLRVEQASPKYVALVLGTRRWRGLIEIEASGTSASMQNISQADLANLPMDLPTLGAQHAAVSRIETETSRVDALIGNARRFIELSKERRSALIMAAVTGQVDVRTKVGEGAA